MKKGFLLASASGLAMVPGAQAADLAVKAPSMYSPVPVAHWDGWYVGLHAGLNWQQAHNDNIYYAPSTTATGFIGGGQIGVNFQNGNLVYGIELGLSGLSGEGTNVNAVPGYSAANKIRWLGTVLGRVGLAVGNTMVYGTGGLAFGGVRNTHSVEFDPAFIKSESKTRVGWAIGGGVEHFWTPNLSLALEGLFVDLGRSTVTTAEPSKTTKFSNQAVIGRLKMNYKF